MRTERDALADVKRLRDEWAANLAKREAAGGGYDTEGWRIRDFVTNADKMLAALPKSDRPI